LPFEKKIEGENGKFAKIWEIMFPSLFVHAKPRQVDAFKL
jgi:hypothetical protein